MNEERVDRSLIFGEMDGAVERIAPGYFPRGWEEEHLARYLWAARYVEGQRTLDVACGTGYGAPILRSGGAKLVVSLDINQVALQFGVTKYQLNCLRADACAIPLRANSFDVVVSLETIEHLAEPSAFLQETARVLALDGTLLISTPNGARASDHGQNPYHLHEFCVEDLAGMAANAGFQVVSVRGQHWRFQGRAIRFGGVRSLVWELERRATVRIGLGRVETPQYWCLELKRL